MICAARAQVFYFASRTSRVPERFDSYQVHVRTRNYNKRWYKIQSPAEEALRETSDGKVGTG